MDKRLKAVNICLTIAVSIAFLLLGIFVFASSYLRTIEGLIDLYGCFRYYFGVLFGLPNNGLPSITNYSKVLEQVNILPQNLDVFANNVKAYFIILFSKENAVSYISFIGEKSLVAVKVLTILLPCFLAVILSVKTMYGRTNKNHNKDTKPLKIFKRVSSVTYVPIKAFLKQYFEFVNYIKWPKTIWLIMWIFHLNLAAVILEFLAFYLYIAVSFDVGNIYVQLCKLVIDLQVIFKTIPVFAWVILGLNLFDKWRKILAICRLNHYEARNCGFINELPIVSMSCGSMGKKKTTLITDMALSQEVMFRQKAFEILQKNDMKFPFFPWICFENELKKCMEHKTVYNLATVKEWIDKKRSRYDKHLDSNLQLYGYDVKRYGIAYNDSLKVFNLFDVLETYAKAYFIYVIQSSLIVSNYSVRTDNQIIDEGNFPLWHSDFFPETVTKGRHAKILDFDLLRLGKKVIENNPKIGSFEFGVIAITEIGKERGNNLELKEVKKGTIETNQKNDLFNSWLKMCRHSATVDNFPFIKVFTDEQRPESWGADARDLADIVTIVKGGEQKITLPFFTIEEMLYEWSFNRFINLYYDFRYRRGDNTLLIYVLKQITSILYKHYIRLYNRFGYSTLSIIKERGIMDGKKDKKRYFLMNKKIYSRRFSTDCFSDYFNDMARKTKVGLNDYLEYATEKATVGELKTQNSYFINALYKDVGDNHKEE